MMFAGFDNNPILYTTDITGNYLRYKANAIGENDEKIKKLLREEYRENMTSKEGIKLALKIFKEVQENDFSIDRFDVGILEEGKIGKLSGKEIGN